MAGQRAVYLRILFCAGTVLAGGITKPRAAQQEFIGVGFHLESFHQEQSAVDLAQVYWKRWRELNPSFARFSHDLGWNLTAVLPTLRVLQHDTNTTMYATTWNPTDCGGVDAAVNSSCLEAFAAAAARDIAAAVGAGGGLSNLRYYCFTNEMSLGTWGAFLQHRDTWATYQRALRSAFDGAGLDVGLLATDASGIVNWDTIEWAAGAQGVDDVTGVYGGHHYYNDHGVHDDSFALWLQMTAAPAMAAARARGKQLIVGETGAEQWAHGNGGDKHRYGFENWDGCFWFDQPDEPWLGIQLAEAAIAFMRSGVAAVGFWTYSDCWDDQYGGKYANKWGTSRNQRGSGGAIDRSPRYHHFALGLLTRHLRGPARVWNVTAVPGHATGAESTDEPPLLAVATQRTTDDAWTVVIVSRRSSPTRFQLQLPAGTSDLLLRRFVYEACQPPLHPFADLQPHEADVRTNNAVLSDVAPVGSVLVYASSPLATAPPSAVEVHATAAGSSTTQLTWAASTAGGGGDGGRVAYYRVYHGKQQIGATVDTSFEDPRAPDPKAYLVTAVSYDGNESPRAGEPALSRCAVADRGYSTKSRGWFDAQGQGVPNDYCRFIGDAGGFFSCRLATNGACTDTPPGACVFKAPLIVVCDPVFTAVPPVGVTSRCSGDSFTGDLGYDGNGNYTRGWYDAQCQGQANDFCRWVGLKPNEEFACQLSNDCNRGHDYVSCPLVRGVPCCPGHCGVP
jgi:hypothetical protein